MKLRFLFNTSRKALVAHKSRTFLTVLGIVIGITSIILIMAIGRGAEGLILNEIGGLGGETIVIRPGQEPKGPNDLAESIFSDSLKANDITALLKKANVPGLADLAPAVIVPGSVSYLGETFRPTTLGWSAEFMGSIYNTYPETGRFFTEQEIRQRAAVAVIGSKVAEELFADDDPIGKNIRIKNRNFRVVGVLQNRGQVAFVNINELVIIPYTSAQTYLLGINHYHEIIVRASDAELVDRTVRDITLTLREAHGITDPTKDDFYVVTQEGLVDQIRIIVSTLTIFLASMVAIALLVGGIGIMNIMLVSVTERTQEIGLRKALGATERDIMVQFLLEAVLLTATGGIIGIILGASFAFLAATAISQFGGLNWPFVFPISAVVIGLSVSAGVGLVFGLYPARQAARKTPIEALRYE